MDKLLIERVAEDAKTYWMLGWTWDEIESILEDLGFPDDAIEEGVSKAQAYAKKIVKKGPFNIFKKNQLIRLNNNEIGQVEEVSSNNISVILGDGETVLVEYDDIDIEASAKLAKAYVFREAAHKMITAQKDYIIPVRPEEYAIAPKTKPEFKVTIKPSPGAPPGWAKTTPHITDVEEVSDSVGLMLNEIEAAQKELDVVKQELKVANEMVSEVRLKRKELEKKQHEIAKNIFAILGSQMESIDDLEQQFFKKYKDKLVGLRRRITEQALPVGVVEELEVLKKILETNHPRIYNKVMDALEEYKQANTMIVEKIEELFAYYQPKKQKFAQLQTLKDWASRIWSSIKQVFNDLYEFVFPTIDDSVEAINEFLMLSGKAVAASKVSKAINLLKKA